MTELCSLYNKGVRRDQHGPLPQIYVGPWPPEDIDDAKWWVEQSCDTCYHLWRGEDCFRSPCKKFYGDEHAEARKRCERTLEHWEIAGKNIMEWRPHP